MVIQWAQRPTRPVPPDIIADRTALAKEVAARAKLYAEAVAASERESLKRLALDPGTSRAKLTTANARWARAAEDRDAKERDFLAALEAAGLSGCPV